MKTNIAELRKANKISQEELARANEPTQVSKSESVTKIE